MFLVENTNRQKGKIACNLLPSPTTVTNYGYIFPAFFIHNLTFPLGKLHSAYRFKTVFPLPPQTQSNGKQSKHFLMLPNNGYELPIPCSSKTVVSLGPYFIVLIFIVGCSLL